MGATYAARARLPAAAAERRCQRRGSLGGQSRGAPPLREPPCPAFPHVRRANPTLPTPCPPFPLLLPSVTRAVRSAERRGGEAGMGEFPEGSNRVPRRVARGREAGPPRHRGVGACADPQLPPSSLHLRGSDHWSPTRDALPLLIPSIHGLL